MPFDPCTRPAACPRRCAGLVAGGGFPEVYAEALGGQRPAAGRRPASASGRGLVTWAECGACCGCATTSTARPWPASSPPGDDDGPPDARLPRRHGDRGRHPLGPAGTELRGHEFHYSTIEPAGRPLRAAPAATAAAPAGSAGRGWWPPTCTPTSAARPDLARAFVQSLLCPTSALPGLGSPPVRKSSIYLPDELKHALAELAARSGRSEAELIRQAIERLVAVRPTARRGAAPRRRRSDAPARPRRRGRRARRSRPGHRQRPGDAARGRPGAGHHDRRPLRRPGRDGGAVGRRPTAAVQRVPFAIGADAAQRAGLARRRGGGRVAGTRRRRAGRRRRARRPHAVDDLPGRWPSWSRRARPAVCRRGRARHHGVPGGRGGRAVVAARAAPGRRAGGRRRRRRPRPPPGRRRTTAVVALQGATDAADVKAVGRAAPSRRRRRRRAQRPAGRAPRRRWPTADDGPISYLATVIFPPAGRSRPRSRDLLRRGRARAPPTSSPLRGAERLARGRRRVWAASLVPAALLDHCRPDAEVHDSKDHDPGGGVRGVRRPPDAAIVRLHSGDPTVYSAIAEQIAWCLANDRAFEIVPGVSVDAAAAAAAAGCELTDPRRRPDRRASPGSPPAPAPRCPTGETIEAYAATGATWPCSCRSATSTSSASGCWRRRSAYRAGHAGRDRPPRHVARRAGGRTRRSGGWPTTCGRLGIDATTVLLVGPALAGADRAGAATSTPLATPPGSERLSRGADRA